MRRRNGEITNRFRDGVVVFSPNEAEASRLAKAVAPSVPRTTRIWRPLQFLEAPWLFIEQKFGLPCYCTKSTIQMMIEMLFGVRRGVAVPWQDEQWSTVFAYVLRRAWAAPSCAQRVGESEGESARAPLCPRPLTTRLVPLTLL